jgi:hypothetical protein
MRVRVPAHVVHRDFGSETVALNLEHGTYHGLNPTAARMLEALECERSLEGALGRLERELDAPREKIERDLRELCQELAERGLVEVEEDAG